MATPAMWLAPNQDRKSRMLNLGGTDVMRGIVELLKAVSILKAVHETVTIVLFGAALYLRWKYGSGFSASVGASPVSAATSGYCVKQWVRPAAPTSTAAQKFGAFHHARLCWREKNQSIRRREFRAHVCSGSKFTVEATWRASRLYLQQLTNFGTAANGRRVSGTVVLCSGLRLRQREPPAG
jgi:hypothetical protein